MLEQAFDEYDFCVDDIEFASPTDNGTTIVLAFRIHKRLDGEIWTCTEKASLSSQVYQQNSQQKFQSVIPHHIQRIAGDIIEKYNNFAKETVNVAGTTIEISYREGGWAECKQCNERITLEGLQNTITPIEIGEDDFSSQPVTYSHEVERFIRELDEEKQDALKYYLLGGLRKRCRCDFGARTKRFI